MSAPLTAAIVATLPAYTAACERRPGGHSTHEVTGYEVVATLQVGAVCEVRLIGTGFEVSLEGHADALTLARQARSSGEFTYAYVSNVYACGCRQVGRVARTGGVKFVA